MSVVSSAQPNSAPLGTLPPSSKASPAPPSVQTTATTPYSKTTMASKRDGPTGTSSSTKTKSKELEKKRKWLLTNPRIVSWTSSALSLAGFVFICASFAVIRQARIPDSIAVVFSGIGTCWSFCLVASAVFFKKRWLTIASTVSLTVSHLITIGAVIGALFRFKHYAHSVLISVGMILCIGVLFMMLISLCLIPKGPKTKKKKSKNKNSNRSTRSLRVSTKDREDSTGEKTAVSATETKETSLQMESGYDNLGPSPSNGGIPTERTVYDNSIIEEPSKAAAVVKKSEDKKSVKKNKAEAKKSAEKKDAKSKKKVNKKRSKEGSVKEEKTQEGKKTGKTLSS